MEYHMHYSPNAPGATAREITVSTEPVHVEKRRRFFHKNKLLIGFYLFVAFLFGMTLFYIVNTRKSYKELYQRDWNGEGRDSETLNSDFIINSLLNSNRGKKFILSKLEELIVSYENDLNVVDENTKKKDYENLVLRSKHIRNGKQKDELNTGVMGGMILNAKGGNNNIGGVVWPIYEDGKIWNVSFLLDNLDGVVAFDNFMKTFQKEYGTLDEKHKRFTNFMFNYLKVKKHNNRDDVYYQIGINKFSDMTYEEFRAKYLTLKTFQSTDMGGLSRLFTEESVDSLIKIYKKMRLQQENTSRYEHYDDDDAVVDKDDDGVDGDEDYDEDEDDDDYLMVNYDWRKFDVAKHVKDQGDCGSCWAFSVVASIEAQYMISKHLDIQLSEQQLLDCSKKNRGCEGGYLNAAFNYVLSGDGLCTEEDYPYLEVARSLCFTGMCTNRYPINKIYHVGIDKLKKTLRYVGPVSVDIHVNFSFVMYQKGIYEGDCDVGDKPNHTVLAIGYGVTTVFLEEGHFRDVYYYIVKNSWGPTWGENGYMRIMTDPQGTEQQCNFANEGYVPTVVQESSSVNIKV